MALNMRVYNIRRCITILGIPELINKLKNWSPDYRGILFPFFNTTSLKTFRTMENLIANRLLKITHLHIEFNAVKRNHERYLLYLKFVQSIFTT